MKHSIAAAVAAALLQLASAPALASSASATLSHFQVHLIDLDPGDGIVPSVTFENLDGGTFAAAGGATSGGQSASEVQYGGQPFGDASASGALGSVGGTAAITGNAFGGGASVAATAFSSGPGDAGDGTVWLGDGSYAMGFFLSANTRLVITGDLATAATSTSSDPDANAFGLITLELDIGNAMVGYAQSSSSMGATTGNGPLTASDSRSVDFSFDNPTLDDIGGVFYGSLEASASDLGTTPAVPEPANAALLLAGLGVVAAAMRRRAAR